MVFLQKVTAVLEETLESGDWEYAKIKIVSYLIPLICIYAGAAVVSILNSQLMAYMTQKFLHKLRTDLFNKMQTLPLSYFDTHKHGDIMSHYTNDIDTLRQLVSMAIPNIIRAGVVVITVFVTMLRYSIWLTLIMVVGIIVMMLVTGKVGAGSAKYFIRQQKAVAATEGYIQEIMNGQKVVKVFNHEGKVTEEFNKLNDGLAEDSGKANTYANILAPIINNIGNIIYVLLAVAGGIMTALHVVNFSFSGLPMGVDIVVPFLNGSKQFMGNINQLTMQMNAIVMAGAGAQRIFDLLDEKPETDDGYVTLVNANIASDGTITEADHQTGHWAWKHPHKADGTITYTELKGDVLLRICGELKIRYVRQGPEILIRKHRQILHVISRYENDDRYHYRPECIYDDDKDRGKSASDVCFRDHHGICSRRFACYDFRDRCTHSCCWSDHYRKARNACFPRRIQEVRQDERIH